MSEQCFTSPPTQYRLYGRVFTGQKKRPNQRYQSTKEDVQSMPYSMTSGSVGGVDVLGDVSGDFSHGMTINWTGPKT